MRWRCGCSDAKDTQSAICPWRSGSRKHLWSQLQRWTRWSSVLIASSLNAGVPANHGRLTPGWKWRRWRNPGGEPTTRWRGVVGRCAHLNAPASQRRGRSEAREGQAGRRAQVRERQREGRWPNSVVSDAQRQAPTIAAWPQCRGTFHVCRLVQRHRRATGRAQGYVLPCSALRAVANAGRPDSVSALRHQCHGRRVLAAPQPCRS